MADEIKMDVDFSDLRTRKKWLDAYIGKMVIRLVNMTSLAVQKHIRMDLFGVYPSGTTDSTLSTRSGKLKKSVINIPAVKEGDNVYGGVAVGTVYGRVHFGKSGQVTEITPKNGKFLTIPLRGALDSHGTSRGSAQDRGIFGDTFIAKSKAGNLIIFGKQLYVKGKKAGQARTDILPLFVLKNKVTVRARIHPEDLRAFAQPILGKGMAEIKAGLMGPTLLEGV